MLIEPIQLAWPADSWGSCHVVVAVSGGADSVALLRALSEIHRQTPNRGDLIVGHFNHRLRGKASDADAAWVGQLAQELDLDCEVAQAAADKKLTSEESARSARYEFLLKLAEQRGARYIATAHTAGDQVETVLMRVLRGSGMEGLAGIQAKRRISDSVTLVRPLLEVRRESIEQYLEQLEQDYRIDASNQESMFTRNWIRNELLPLLRDRLPSDPDRSLLRLAQQASQWSEMIDSLARPLFEQSVKVEGERIEINRVTLQDKPMILICQLVRLAWRKAGWPEQAMGMAEWQRVGEAVLMFASQDYTLPGNVQLTGHGNQLVLVKASGC